MGEVDPKLPWRRVREISQKFGRGDIADDRGTATAAVGVNGIARSRGLSSGQTAGKARLNERKFAGSAGMGPNTQPAGLLQQCDDVPTCQKAPIGAVSPWS